jgi:hypothetical protein
MDRRAILKYTAYVTGYALTAPLTAAFLSGCKAEPTAPDFQPSFLSENTYRGMRAMVDAMLPETKTPGAVEMGVPEFIDLVLDTYAEEELQQHIQQGLQRWLSDTQQADAKPYHELDPTEQLRLLNELDTAAKQEAEAMEEAEALAAGREPSTDEEVQQGLDPNGDLVKELQPWWLELKSLAINGFFASQYIGTEVLAYDPVPGVYNGAYPLSEVGRAWSL